ncbi:hypothetical protein [Amniculibacterium aquaticum]|uniref:hypothetical protein n=1 Tax=Amniculibacterium aquaticum TaxID=2479858 RepID=UPI000F5969A2|nr:hypothetical protein [Amniculibacterium aquaticum]
MKNIFLLVFGFLLISISINANNFTSSLNGDDEVNKENVFSNKFYKYDSEGKVVYLSKKEIKKMWENQLKSEGYDLKFEKFEILSSTDEKTGKTYYFLKTTSSDKTMETGAFFTKTKLGLLLGDKECSCSGCPNGCNLSVFGSNCSCGLGGPQNCTKTEKAVVKSFTLD